MLMMSARFPASSEPICSPILKACAPRMVAIANACSAGSAVGSPEVTFCSLAARSISSIMSTSLLEPATPSVPNPTGMPACSIFSTGATPLASFMLLDGQCEMPVPAARRRPKSAGSSHTGVRGQRPALQHAQIAQRLGWRFLTLLHRFVELRSWSPPGG